MFEAIRRAQPARLYVAADGPRVDRVGESAQCDEVRRIATAVDWPCTVTTLFRQHNLGCKQAVAQAISWFFEQEEEGIILEDDVLPVHGFFAYCEELLLRYRFDEQVAAISGCNLIGDRHSPEASYFFTRQNHVWGWASWRRAWHHYEIDMRSWPAWDRAGGLAKCTDDPCAEHYWRQVFERVYQGKVDTWDYQWMFACWRNGGLTALPLHNMVANLGIGSDVSATHTSKRTPKFLRDNPAREVGFALRHPVEVTRDVEADRLIRLHVIGLTRLRCLKRHLGRLLRQLVSGGLRHAT